MMGSAGRGSAAGPTTGFGLSLAVAMLLNSVLVVLKESSPRVMAWMRGAVGHHWVTHAIILLVVYFALGLVLSRAGVARAVSSRAVLALCTASVVLSSLVIVGYYTLHTLIT